MLAPYYPGGRLQGCLATTLNVVATLICPFVLFPLGFQINPILGPEPLFVELNGKFVQLRVGTFDERLTELLHLGNLVLELVDGPLSEIAMCRVFRILGRAMPGPDAENSDPALTMRTAATDVVQHLWR